MSKMEAKRIRDMLSWWSMASLVVVLAGIIFHVLVDLLTFPVAVLLLTGTSTILSALGYLVYKRAIESNENRDLHGQDEKVFVGVAAPETAIPETLQRAKPVSQRGDPSARQAERGVQEAAGSDEEG